MNLSPGAYFLYGVLALYADSDGVCHPGRYPGRRQLAALMQVSEESVKRFKRELAEKKHIECHENYDEDGRQTTDMIYLTPRGVNDEITNNTNPGNGVVSSLTPRGVMGGVGGGSSSDSKKPPNEVGEGFFTGPDTRVTPRGVKGSEQTHKGPPGPSGICAKCDRPALVRVGMKHDPKTFQGIGGYNLCITCYEQEPLP